MSNNALRFGMVVSTAGSVMNEVLRNHFFRSRVQVVITSTAGAACDKARAHGVDVEVLDEQDVELFSERCAGTLRERRVDYVFSFYTQFFSRAFRTAFTDRVLNFHPSLLPAFKGADGFGDTVAYQSRFAGNTIEFIADVMDEGKIIMQTVCPVDTNALVERTRHQVFVQQCRALLQVARWLQDGRVSVDGRAVLIARARFDSPSFSPSLDWAEAAQWAPPDPFAATL